MNKGLFITFEGPDGSGKSTAARLVHAKLKEMGIKCVLTREPGGTPIGEAIREILLDEKNTEMSYRAEALLYAASRAQHVEEKIKPLLQEGVVVICDRYVFSSLAYQGFSRGLGVDTIMKLNKFAMNGVYPDKVLFFDLAPEVALQRKFNQNEVNRMENEGNEFHKLTYDGYQKAISIYNKNVDKINAEKTVEEIVEECVDKILFELNK